MSALLSFLSILLALGKATLRSNDLPFSLYLDPSRQVNLEWGFDNPQGIITFQLTFNTTGWLGFGFSPNGGMNNADIVIGGLRSNGSYFQDCYATGNARPVADDKQSYALLSMTEQDGQTRMKFQRPMDTCDDKDLLITDQPIYLIYAYGETDEIKYHGGRRGQKQVHLLNYLVRSLSPNATYLSVRVENITIPPKDTYYHCKVMQLPVLATKQHIYQIEPIIENPTVVHHMLLYRCPTFVEAPYDNECYMGHIGDACFAVMASWAVGGGSFELPENTGIPIGGNYRSHFYRLEIHYNNPQMKSGITDSSGLKLYYTDQLRQHDVGILTTGVPPMYPFQYKIPPKITQFHTYGVCNTINFSQLVNKTPDLQVFAVLLHTHLAGRKIRVGHFRNQQQIDFLGLNENYNFDLQQIVSLGSLKTIKQSDDIVVECTYNTENRNQSTKMGLSSTDEMCLAFLLYYPAINITSCISHPNTSLLPSSYDLMSGFQGNTVENLLKTLPQIQVISDVDGKMFIDKNSVVKDLMKTPTAVCKDSGNPGAGATRFHTTWIMNTGAITLLLCWIIIM
nr:DBH-like monooxygenase protein 2 homolog [Nothobranchius furzeri]